MEATLSFNMPEDTEEFEMAVSASRLYFAISEFSNKLRSMYKYENIETVDPEEIRSLLYEILGKHQINTEWV